MKGIPVFDACATILARIGYALIKWFCSYTGYISGGKNKVKTSK